MRYDDVIIGGGHNGLTAAAYLARAGRRVLLLERSGHVGGAAVSAPAFAGVDAHVSRYSYLVSLLPRQIITDLGLDLRLIRRRYSSYTPVPGSPERGLLVDHGDDAETAASFRRLTGSDETYAAWCEFYSRMGSLAEKLFPTVLQPLRSRADVRELVSDNALFDTFTAAPVDALLDLVTSDDTVRGIIATDALIGTFASLSDADLRANVCLLYHLIGGGTGDWDVPVGGMGALTRSLAAAASAAGASIVTGTEVTSVDPSRGEVTWAGGRVEGVNLLFGCAPLVANRLLAASGAEAIETEPRVEGAQLKVNMLLTRLPRLRDESVDPRAAFAGTFHVNEGHEQLERAYAAAQSGRVPELPPCEIYCHTLSDRSILGPELAASEAQTLTLFGLHMPTRLFLDDNEGTTRRALAATLRSLDSVLGEPIENVLALDADGRPCIEAKSPVDIEAAVGLPGGNIFQRSLQWPWAESDSQVGTWGVETAYDNVMLAGAGARRGGGVSGIPGHNAARAVLER